MFQRYMLVKEIIDAIKEDRKTTILDAGRYPGVVSDFFSTDQRFIIDLKTCKKENFVRADCQFLPFRSADRTLYEYILNVLEREDENLKEHVKYGLPNLGELRDFLDSNRLVHVEFSNGHLSNWLFTQVLNSRN